MAAEDSCQIETKKMKMTKRVGTHSGSFHCDEALACYMLVNHVQEFKGGEIVRSRDPKVWETCDILVDVCGEYVPELNKFDHHQRGFTETFNEKFNRTKLSSAGLIYKHYGREVIADVLSTDGFDEETLELFYQKMYEVFIEAVDGVDNGVNQYDGEPHYQSSTSLGSRVGSLNPWWNQKDVDVAARFQQAMALTGGEFVSKVEYYARSWWPARAIVQSCMQSLGDVHPSGEIMLLNQYCPWKKHLFELEEVMGLQGQIKYVVFHSNDNSHRIQCVPVRLDSFENRKSLPADWRGLRGEELSEKSGIPDCIFIHAAGFIGGTKTPESAMAIAKYAIEN